jgi:hypothetical protein
MTEGLASHGSKHSSIKTHGRAKLYLPASLHIIQVSYTWFR